MDKMLTDYIKSRYRWTFFRCAVLFRSLAFQTNCSSYKNWRVFVFRETYHNTERKRSRIFAKSYTKIGDEGVSTKVLSSTFCVSRSGIKSLPQNKWGSIEARLYKPLFKSAGTWNRRKRFPSRWAKSVNFVLNSRLYSSRHAMGWNGSSRIPHWSIISLPQWSCTLATESAQSLENVVASIRYSFVNW